MSKKVFAEKVFADSVDSGVRARPLAGDRCGCAMGARFLAVGLTYQLGWYAWHWHVSPLGWGTIALRVFGVAFCSATLGKIVGIVAFRMRRNQRHFWPLHSVLSHRT